MIQSVEQVPEVINPIDNALNVLSEGVDQNIRIHEVFWNLDEKQTDIAIKILSSSLDV